MAFAGYGDMQKENVGAEREDKNLGRLMGIKYNIYKPPWGLPEIASKTRSQPHRGLKPGEEKSVKHDRNDFYTLQLIYFGTKILLVTEKVYKSEFHYT